MTTRLKAENTIVNVTPGLYLMLNAELFRAPLHTKLALNHY